MERRDPKAGGKNPAGKSPAKAKGPSQRQLRVGEQIRHILAGAMIKKEFSDPFFDNLMVTVSEVRVSPDLRNATAFVSPLGGGDAGPLLKAMQRIKPFLRRQIASDMALKFAPNISFEADGSFDEAERISKLLNSSKVRRDLNKRLPKSKPADSKDV